MVMDRNEQQENTQRQTANLTADAAAASAMSSSTVVGVTEVYWRWSLSWVSVPGTKQQDFYAAFPKWWSYGILSHQIVIF